MEITVQDAIGFQTDKETVKRALWKLEVRTEFCKRPSGLGWSEAIQNPDQAVNSLNGGRAIHRHSEMTSNGPEATTTGTD